MAGLQLEKTPSEKMVETFIKRYGPNYYAENGRKGGKETQRRGALKRKQALLEVTKEEA